MGFDAVALVSGGKDSVMAAMMAQSYGHNIVALANLLPADGDVEELDSHCFQTVGHRAVGVYHELTGLPLFRRKIVGTSAHVEMSYDVCDERVKGDEVEDLRALLAAVVRELPNVRAVTSGAILSDYQRLRVEAVCADLGLTSLAYLWRQPQGLMLETICASDVDAVLCKVAAMGLKPTGTSAGRSSTRGHPLRDRVRVRIPLLRRGRGVRDVDDGLPAVPPRFSPVLSGRPAPGRGHQPRPFAPSAHLAVAAVAVGVKDHTIDPGRLVDANDVDPPAVTRRRRTIDAFEGADVGRGRHRGNARLTRSWRRGTQVLDSRRRRASLGTESRGGLLRRRRRGPRRLGCTSWSSRCARTAGTGATCRWCSSTSGTCRTSRRSTRRTCGWCRRPNPRRGLASSSPCPGDTPVAMDVLVGVGSGASARKSLHVQSVSCWAPACIGPCAQAVTHLGLTHMAGVIGMVPATLDMIRSDVDVDVDVDANATEARRAWRSAAAGSGLGRHLLDCLSCTVYSSIAGGDGGEDASDEAFAGIMRGEGWQDDVDVPGGPHAAKAGVPTGSVHRNGRDGFEPGTAAVSGDGSGLGAAAPRRWRGIPWSPTSPCPGFRRTRAWRFSPCYSTATGRVRTAAT